MSSPFGKLERILRLEQEQGFHDRAVIGGLERFLVFWLKEAQAKDAETPEGLTVVQVASALSNYARRSEQERRERVEKLLNRIAGAPEEPVSAVETTEPRAEGIPTATSEPVETPPVESPAEATRAPAMTPEPEEPPVESMPFRSTGLKPTASVVALKGVSTVTQEKLARLGIATVDDLVHHFPRRHDDLRHLKPIGQLEPGLPATVVGAVHSVSSQRARGGRQMVRVLVSDGTGLIEATWFGQPYLARRFKQGMEIVLSGTVSEYLGRLVLTSPEWEPLQRELLHTGRLVPAYALTEGISARRMRSLIRSTVADVAPQIVDPLPDDILRERRLMGLAQALEQAHFPDNEERLEQAQRRLAFDEFLLLQLGLLRQRRAWRRQKSRALFIPRERIDAFIQGLPFELTGAQTREIEAILEDLSQAVPMSRLLQGDVGSGKTVVAAAAILVVAHNGLQVAVMAPTTILAEQHHRTLTSLLGADESTRCELLVGRLPEEEKARIRAGLQEGHIRIVVGTHALIQDTVRFAKLGLVIVDEQHRFGVAQRQALLDKGRPEGGESPANDGAEPVAVDAAGLCPHLLAMSATPIPRSLALAVYGDMDVGIIDEMPPSRKEGFTALRDGASRERIYAFIRTQIEAGRQAYVICAAIEEQEPFDVRGAVQEHQRLQKVFPRIAVGLLHGKMESGAKDEVMSAFAAGEIGILVATSVVEVGIDVPNATVIMIENATRFGLAQLHQFRGRVGRGEHRSYCILMSDGATAAAQRRLEIVESLSDGLALAEKDLQLRGPGDFFGMEQHGGLPTLRMAKLSDTTVLEQAREAAIDLLGNDPDLAEPQHSRLAAAVSRFWSLADGSERGELH